MTSLEILTACDADEQIFERGSNFTYEEFAQIANVHWQERVKQLRQALDERSHLLGVLAVYREQEDQLKAEIRRIVSVTGGIVPCADCDGSGYDARGSACCRIPGHAKECNCQVCLWMRSHYADQAEIKRLKRAGAILARFAWDHADDTEDKHLEAAELFREEWRAMLAEMDPAQFL